MIAVVTSGKGGVGKSTVTVGLACALAERGQRVLVIDTDAGLRSLDLMLGVSDRAVYDLSDIFARRQEPSAVVVESPLCNNVFVIPAPPTLDGMTTPEEMTYLCRGLAENFDTVLIDCPAGIGRGFELAVAAADRAVLVTTPDPVAARDVYVASTLLDRRGISYKMVVNRLRVKAVQKKQMPDLDAVMDEAQVPLLGVIPEDEAVTISTARGERLPKKCPAARCIENIAARFLGESVPLFNFK